MSGSKVVRYKRRPRAVAFTYIYNMLRCTVYI